MLTVTCVAQNCSADGCLYTLNCSALGSGSGNISYSWSAGGLSWSEGPTALVESWTLLDKPLIPLTCTAQNPVSSRNVTIMSPSAVCAGNSHGNMHGWVAGMGHILLLVAPAFP